MITDSALSKEKLGKFLMDSSDFNELNVPELTRLNNTVINNLIINNDNLIKINLPSLEQQPGIIIGKNLKEVKLPSLQIINNRKSIISSGILSSKFLQETKLQKLELPELQGTLEEESDLNSTQMGFSYNYWLNEVSLGNAYLKPTYNAAIGRFWFYYNFSLQKLILRYPYVIPLNDITALNTTPIAVRKGFIFVPDNLLEDYQSTVNWSNFQSCFRPITQLNNLSEEDRSKLQEDTIQDDWETIINKCNNHSIDDYKIGDTKTIEINNMPTQMVIVDFNKDILSDNSGTAAITWMEKHISRYNPISMNVNSGDLRNYQKVYNFHNIEKPALLAGLPEIVKNNIKTVKKNSFGWNAVNSQATMTSDETIWIPSAAELGLQVATQIEPDDPYRYFSNALDSSNLIFSFGFTNSQPLENINHVALRTFTSSSNYVDTINRNGRFVSGQNSQFPQYLIIGFCT